MTIEELKREIANLPEKAPLEIRIVDKEGKTVEWSSASVKVEDHLYAMRLVGRRCE